MTKLTFSVPYQWNDPQAIQDVLARYDVEVVSIRSTIPEPSKGTPKGIGQLVKKYRQVTGKPDYDPRSWEVVASVPDEPEGLIWDIQDVIDENFGLRYLKVGSSTEETMDKKDKTQEKETTLEGLIEALIAGDITAIQVVEAVEKDPDLLEVADAVATLRQHAALARKRGEDVDEAGLQLAVGKKKPKAKAESQDDDETDDELDEMADTQTKVSQPDKASSKKPGGGMDSTQEPPTPTEKDVPSTKKGSMDHSGYSAPGEPDGDQIPTTRKGESQDDLPSFDEMLDERCPPFVKKGKKKSKKSKQSESIHEFSAPERQDVIQWARGNAPKRTSEKTAFWFKENVMFSKGQPIAERNLEEKTAKVLNPKTVDANTGRHAVLCQKGLRYAGYNVEFVDSL